MIPRDHVILSSAASIGLSPFLGINSIVFWLASILIDIDHYLDYLYYNGLRDFGFRRMFDYHYALGRLWGRADFLSIQIFHTAEFLVPFYIVSEWLDSFFLKVVLMGFLFHVTLDMIYMFSKNAFFKRAYSAVEYFIRKRSMARRGLYPARLMEETALGAIKKNGTGD